MNIRRLLPVVALIFVGTLIWRMPASWAMAALPDGLRCQAAAGTVWNGHCGTLISGAAAVNDVRWQLQPSQLLNGKLGLHLNVQDANLRGSVQLQLGLGGQLHGTAAECTVVVPSTLLPAAPAGLSGELQLSVPDFELRNGRLTSIGGTARLRKLRQQQPPLLLGDYEWRVNQTTLPTGRVAGPVRELGGPLRVSGTLAISLNGEFEFEARVATADTADPLLEQALSSLGPADATGMRQVSIAGSLR